MTDWANTKYVSLSTFRRDGTKVASPVWITAVGNGEFGFTTDPGSWKVKRLRNNDRVELQPCSMRGVVSPDAPIATGTARVIGSGTDYTSLVAALRRKYGIQVALIEFGGAIKQRIKGNASPDCGVIIQLDQ